MTVWRVNRADAFTVNLHALAGSLCGLLQAGRAEVANDSEERKGKAGKGHADQGEVRTEELGHATPAPFAV
jgi:hypothetical protein